MKPRRDSGLLLHPTSLPGNEGIGTIGNGAVEFLDSLRRSEQTWWQMLPVGPTGYADSPYQSPSTFAGNPLLIDLSLLASEGISTTDVEPTASQGSRIDYGQITATKAIQLEQAAASFQHTGPRADEFESFRSDHTSWLGDYSLYTALKQAYGGRSWIEWDHQVRDRDPDALDEARHVLADSIRKVEIVQFFFERQWRSLRREASKRGIGLVGDLPIFVAHDSADVWANRHLFDLDADGDPVVVAGVPPDYFSETGQRWGNPLYLWDRHRCDGYRWWTERLRTTLQRFDLVRIDHFRGFVDYWEIPSEEPTAIGGHWVEGPGSSFFETVGRQLGRMPIIAEDLGIITPEVTALRKQFGFPGMRVLQFGFDTAESDNNLHHPDRYPTDVVAYTGTHDNDTAVGWFWADNPHRDPELFDRGRIDLLERGSLDSGDVHWTMISLVEESSAQLAIIPVQDLLGLGSAARMNTPATVGGNWDWRMAEYLPPNIEVRLAAVTYHSRRSSRRRG